MEINDVFAYIYLNFAEVVDLLSSFPCVVFFACFVLLLGVKIIKSIVTF